MPAPGFTRPNEKAVFLIAAFGVTLATLALFLAPVKPVDGGSSGDTAGATSRPTSGPTSHATSRPVGVSAQKTSMANGLDPEKFPTADYARLLETYLSDGRVDYEALASKGKASLEKLADAIAQTDPERLDALPNRARDAWYINAYNILTLKTIVDHYPVDSIIDIDQPWDTALPVAHQQLTLNQVEHEKLRWRDADRTQRILKVDPRLHFAVNCASIGCPVLQDVPFTADNIEELYEKGVRAYISDPANYSYDADTRTVAWSQLLDWYGEDFTLHYGQESKQAAERLAENGVEKAENVAAVAAFLANYVKDPIASETMRSGAFELEILNYDWKLNKQ